MSSREAPGDQVTSGLDRRAELREFLRSRRARLKPEDVGLPSYGRRRVPGLRREELAPLAGVSYAYYARLEQPDRESTTQAAPPPQRLRPTVQHLLDAVGVLAYVAGRGMDILGWNRLAAAVFGDWAQLPPEERNMARLIFLSPETRDRFADPDRTALSVVSILRLHVGRSPGDPRLASLVEELLEKSEEFRRAWVRHEVGCTDADNDVRLRHPLVGEFSLFREVMALPDETPSGWSPTTPSRLPVGGSPAAAGQLGDEAAAPIVARLRLAGRVHMVQGP